MTDGIICDRINIPVALLPHVAGGEPSELSANSQPNVNSVNRLISVGNMRLAILNAVKSLFSFIYVGERRSSRAHPAPRRGMTVAAKPEHRT
jgi:hypothetical protein